MERNPKKYEIAYILRSSIAEETVAEHAQKIAALIEAEKKGRSRILWVDKIYRAPGHNRGNRENDESRGIAFTPPHRRGYNSHATVSANTAAGVSADRRSSAQTRRRNGRTP